MGKNSTDKGKRGEREWVNLLKRYGLTAKRTSQTQARKGLEAPDVTHVLGVAEIKRRKQLPISELYKALEQARSTYGKRHPNTVHYVAARKDRHDWFVVLTPEDFLRLHLYQLFTLLLAEDPEEVAYVLGTFQPDEINVADDGKDGKRFEVTVRPTRLGVYSFALVATYEQTDDEGEVEVHYHFGHSSVQYRYAASTFDRIVEGFEEGVQWRNE